jgi:NhaA family Na+:H+ antiporter
MMSSPRSGLPALFHFVIDNSLLLVVGAVAALVWANTAHDSYEHFAHAVHFAVNDIGMVFFFAIAAKEVFEATLPGGPLASARTAAMPLLSAAGGMVGPALTYLALVQVFDTPELANGWAIPCATDIAFSYLVARFIFGGSHPAVPFLLMLAIADDAMGLMILAIFYPSGDIRLVEGALLLLLAVVVALGLRRRRVVSFWPYILGAGGLSWTALYVGGLHPALALVPIIPFMPHAKRDSGLFDARESQKHDTLNEFEHAFHVPVELMLFFFGLVNAGVPFGSIGVGTWVVLVAILAGKPVGIGLFTALGHALSLRMTGGLTWRDVIVVGCVAGIGFTVALFFATAAFPPGGLLEQTKMGALLSFAGALVAIAAALGLRVGRWQVQPPPRD